MTPLVMLWTDIRILLVDTTRIWWRLLPRILTIYLLGWLGFQVAMKIAIIAGDVSAWLALLIFAFSFVSRLAAFVLILRLAGNALGVRSLIPADEYEDDDRDAGVTRLLAITLLPFLGIYTAFGLVSQASDQMLIESVFRNGPLGDNSVLSKMRLNGDGVPTSRYLLAAAIIIGTYLVRRILDLLHERTGWRPLGIVVAFIEAFFVLITITAGSDVVTQLFGWVQDRQFMAWLSDLCGLLDNLIGGLGIDPTAVYHAISTFFGTQLWPLITAGLTKPIFWLAVAALVYGSSVISVAELWRKGRPLASRIRVARRVMERSARRSHPGGRSGASRVMMELKEAFLGDVDDKYLPTLHSLRLILRAGFVFLGAYVVVYAAEEVASTVFGWLLAQTIGGHQMAFWMVWLPAQDLVADLPFEPWRLCLLAVALRRCLQIFRMRAEAAGTTRPAAAPLTAWQAAAADQADAVPAEPAAAPVPQQVGA